MAEYIDIDAPIDVAVYQRNRRIQVTLRQILESNDAKYEAADVREVKRGKWIIETHQIYFEVRCSECGIKSYVHIEDEDTISYANFCPNCGADMREDKANGT